MTIYLLYFPQKEEVLFEPGLHGMPGIGDVVVHNDKSYKVYRRDWLMPDKRINVILQPL